MSNLRYNTQHIHEALPVPVLHYISHSKYEKDWASVPHSHDFTELAFIEGGKGFFSIESQRLPVSAGNLIIIPPNTRHTEISSLTNALEYYFLGISCTDFPLYSDFSHQSGKEGALVAVLGNQSEKVRSIFSGIFTEVQRAQKAHEVMVYSLLLQLMVYLARHTGWLKSEPFTSCTQQHVQAGVKAADIPYTCAKIKTYIEKKYAEKITLDSLAAYSGMSKYHLVREFSKYVNMPPITYMLKCRIEESKQLLTSTEMRIIDIAAGVGFSSASQFSQCFKSFEHCAPSVYRTKKG